MAAQIFDSHAHYHDEAFDEDRDALLAALPGQNICGVINCATDLPTCAQTLALAEQYAYLFAACGVHPHEAAGLPADWLDAVRAFCARPKCVAVGEIGLDYHYDFSPRDVQQAVFAAQLALANELDLPVIVHDRESHEDTLRLLRQYRPQGVVHCFSGSAEMAKEVVALGMYIGLGGATTFKNARRPLEVAAAVPVDRLLIETDCPYMTPVPFRGKRNDSTYIPYAAAAIAAARGETAETVLAQTRANANRLFRLEL